MEKATSRQGVCCLSQYDHTAAGWWFYPLGEKPPGKLPRSVQPAWDIYSSFSWCLSVRLPHLLLSSTLLLHDVFLQSESTLLKFMLQEVYNPFHGQSYCCALQSKISFLWLICSLLSTEHLGGTGRSWSGGALTVITLTWPELSSQHGLSIKTKANLGPNFSAVLPLLVWRNPYWVVAAWAQWHRKDRNIWQRRSGSLFELIEIMASVTKGHLSASFWTG